MAIEWSITIGNILTTALTIFGFVGAGMAVFYAQRTAMAVMSERLSILGARMINMETELKKLTDVVVQMAVERERVNALISTVEGLREFQQWAREKLERIETRDRGQR